MESGKEGRRERKEAARRGYSKCLITGLTAEWNRVVYSS
jgi:hypothetical protein